MAELTPEEKDAISHRGRARGRRARLARGEAGQRRLIPAETPTASSTNA